jgi:hypothetical protein
VADGDSDADGDTDTDSDVGTGSDTGSSTGQDTESDTGVDTGYDTNVPTSGSTWCWLVAPRDGMLAVIQVDMDTGYWFERDAFGTGINESFDTGGLARVGNTLVMAGYTGNEFSWVEADMDAKQVTIGNDAGHVVSVATDGTRILSFCGEHGLSLCTYTNFAALNSGNPSGVLENVVGVTRIGATSDRIYGAWHSTDSIKVFDSADGTLLNTVVLEGWDDWIWGISVVGNVLHIVNSNGLVARFDKDTGAFLDSVQVDLPYPYPSAGHGLWCESY